jgi:hypothetical protein
MTNRALIAVLAAALLVRLALFFALLPLGEEKAFYLGDTVGYLRYVENLSAGHGYTESVASPYIPSGMRTPGLPFIFLGVKIAFGTLIPYVVIQIVMALGIIIIAYRIALVSTGSEKLALGAAILSAFEPYSVFINMSLLTETVFSLVYLAAILALMRYVQRRGWAMLGLSSALFGVAALIRPIAEFMPLLIIALVLFIDAPRMWFRGVILATIPFLIVLSPWLIRNYSVLGSASVSTGGYQNVYSDLGATILSYKNGTEWYVEKMKLNADFAARHNIAVEDLQQYPKLNGAFLTEGLAIMRENPLPTLKAAATVFIAFFTNDAWAYYLQYWGWMPTFTYGIAPIQILMQDGPVVAFEKISAAGGLGLIVPLMGRVFWIVISLCFFVGSGWWIWCGGEKRIFGLLFLLTALYMVTLCFSNGAGINGRYRYPINPVLYAPALFTMFALWRRLMIGWMRWKVSP